jgi:hypothetical protein
MMEALSLANDTDGILQLFETQKAAGIRLQMHIYPIVVNALLKKHRFTDATLLFTEVSDFAMQSEWLRSIRPRLLLAMTRGFGTLALALFQYLAFSLIFEFFFSCGRQN